MIDVFMSWDLCLDILLPTLHSIWQPLVCRLSDSRLVLTPVICEVCIEYVRVNDKHKYVYALNACRRMYCCAS